MKLTKELQICIILTVIGTAKSATERVINRTTEIVTVRYETPESNLSTTNISVVTNLTDSPVDLKDEEDTSEEEEVTKRDSDGSTTQVYDNSKLLFSYVVPVTSDKAKEVEDVEEDDSEDVAVDEEEEEGERENLEDEEESERENLEDEEEKESDEEKSDEEYSEEEEEDEDKGPYRREDIVEQGVHTDDDSDEEHYEAEDEDDHGRADDESITEKGSSSAPISPWRHSYPQLIQEKRPFFEVTTVQPYSNPRPVSYSSVVYDPDGKSKTELSGSFYKKPLEVIPESGVFSAEGEHASEDTKTVPVTKPPIIEEQPIQSLKKDDVAPDTSSVVPNKTSESWEDDKESPEPEVTSSRKYTPKKAPNPFPRLDFDWEEEYYEKPLALSVKKKKLVRVTTPKMPKRTPKSIPPTESWEEDEEEEEEEEDYPELEAVTSNVINEIRESTEKSASTPTRVTNLEESYNEKPEALTSEKNTEVKVSTPISPKSVQLKWEEEEVDYMEPEAVTSNAYYDIQEPTPKMGQRNFEWEEEEELREDVGADPKRYNEKTSQQFHDKTNRENYYEQTINTRFGSKERGTSEEDKNYESEVGDLMKPRVEEWRGESIQNNIVSEEDDAEPEEMTERVVPMKKDRNQLYEYLIGDGRFKQGVSENKESLPRFAPTTPKEEVVRTEAPPSTTTTPKPPKPQPYSFGTITNSQSDGFLTFNTGDSNDVAYNKIVSDIQSLFTPTTRRPTPNHEQQHFLPSHGNCQHQIPDSVNYESFIKPSQTRPSYDEEEEAEEDGEESPMPRRLPMKTYMVQKKPVHRLPVTKPSVVKVTVHPMTYGEVKPVVYRNAVYLPSSVRKVVYYNPRKYHYSPTNHVHRVIRPQPPRRDSLVVPSSRMLIIRKIEQSPA